MTLYLDTSSIVKLYVDEPGSDDVLGLLDASDTIATASLTYVECHAALARRRREGALSGPEFAYAKRSSQALWPHYLVVDLTPEVRQDAAALAERYQLRAGDSVHLASYASIARQHGTRNIEFSSFDGPLNRAAHSLRRSLLRAERKR